MSLQWTLVATFLYMEIVFVLLLVSPILTVVRWQKIFKSNFAQSLSYQSSTIFYIMIIILILFWLDSLREMFKYAGVTERVGEHSHLDAEMQGNMKLFRAQRNFYISGFSLFLTVVIKRIIILISTQATLLAQNEAAMRQAQSATTAARSLLSQKPSSESAQNNSNEAHDKAVSELKNQVKELEAAKLELEKELTKQKKDTEALKSQAQSLEREYDRLNAEHAKVLQSSGDKKSD